MRTLFTAHEPSAAFAISVAELNRHIAQVLASDPVLEDVSVRGEISNFKLHGSGHAYFSLKDEHAQIRCCLWRGNVSGLKFKPGDGNRVIASGKIEHYAARGETSFIVESLHFDGQGAQYEAFERLKAALAADGLFEQSRKKPLPVRPRRIGLISSETGAALHDFLSVLNRRWPLGEIVLVPALVQGVNAPSDLIRALTWAEALEEFDVVVVARGGGSAEDLWCFNDEALCRHAADFPVPLVSAVGHETDFTLFDFVADTRAATPTAAAEIITPDLRELLEELADIREYLRSSVAGTVQKAREKLDMLRSHRALTQPQSRIQEERERLKELEKRLYSHTKNDLAKKQQALKSFQKQLRALDPERVLERGYAILLDPRSKVLSSASAAASHSELTVKMHDGTLEVRVKNP